MSSDSQGPRFSFPGDLGWDCLGPLLLSLVSRAEQSLFSFCVSVDAGLGAGLGGIIYPLPLQSDSRLLLCFIFNFLCFWLTLFFS